MNQLQLPIAVAHGTVRHFRVTIPWASLDRNPVKVEMDGVYLLVGPVKKEDWAAGKHRGSSGLPASKMLFVEVCAPASS